MIVYVLCFTFFGLSFGQPNEEPLFLTPFINNGQFEEAKNLARVTRLPNSTIDIESYSGYITVRNDINSNLFFWFFPNVSKLVAT